MSGLEKLGADPERVLYRLSETCGSDQVRVGEVVVDYRLQGARGIERVGSGWAAEFDREASTTLDSAEEVEEVRAIMAGRHPRTGEILVKPKVAVHPRARLPAKTFVEALRSVAADAGVTVADLLTDKNHRERVQRLERALVRHGESHRAPVGDLEPIAQAAGVDLAEVYEAGELATARQHAEERVVIGNQGYDWTVTRPRSMDVVRAMAPEAMADHMDELFARAVREGLSWLERTCAYGMEGKHGGGHTARRVGTTGWAATITWHRTTRPIDGGPGDPHLHAHVMVPNLVRCSDGEWRTTSAGGRDLYRHVGAASELVLARYRHLLAAEYGISFELDPTTNQWEISGVPPELRRFFARRSQQIDDTVGTGASNTARRAAGRTTAEKKIETTPEQERTSWWTRATRAGWVPQHIIRAVLGHEPPEGGLGAGGRPPHEPGPDDLAARVWDPETGLTAQDKTVAHTKVLRAVAEACPDGVASAEEWERLAERVGGDVRAVVVPQQGGGSHLSNATIRTSSDIVKAEREIIASASARLGEGTATVPALQVQAAAAAFERERGYAPSAEQETAILRLTSAGHGIDTILGLAGSGKTTIMDVARRAWESQGLSVRGAATAAVAAAKLRASSRIRSETVASWTTRIKGGRGLGDVDVLILEEAAMVDDRAVTDLVAQAQQARVKLVAIGDPKQLKAVGVGGAFKRIHEIVGGVELTENRRQRDAVERSALRVWRTGDHATALAMWGATGHVVATPDLHSAYAHMVAAWWNDWSAHGDPHDAIERALMLAATNADVEALNARARVIARETGRLTSEDVQFTLRGGKHLDLAVGDPVRVRRNDRQSRRDQDAEDVLNGYRGVVLEVDRRRGALIEWRQGADPSRAWIPPEQIATGHLSHGYAMTIASAQGLTARTCHTLGLGADAHAVYPAMSRVEEFSTLYLPAAELEPEEVQLALGEARTDKERLDRVLSAYAPTLTDEDDGMVVDLIDGTRPQEKRATESALTRAQAQAGQGPTMAEATPRIAEWEEKAAAAGRRAEELHRELIDLTAQLEGRSRWRARPLARRVEQTHEDLDWAREEQREAVEQAQRLRREATDADLVIARHGSMAPQRPDPRAGGVPADPASNLPTRTSAPKSPAPTPADSPASRPRQ